MPIRWSVIILIKTLFLLHLRDLPLKQSNHNEQYELLLGNRILARIRIYTSKTNCNHKPIQRKLILQLLLILSGDIHQHPDPVKYPCGICSRPVASNHRALQCGNCDFWCHIKCVKVSPSQYEKMKGSSAIWVCPPCGSVQYSSTVLNQSDSITYLSNSFSVLSESHEMTDPEHTTRQNQVPRPKVPALTIMSLNTNSLVSDNKHALLSTLLKEHNPDILCVCESKLDNTIGDSAIFPSDSGYEIINRKDNKFGAGGVLIAVKNTILASPVNDLDTGCEIV